MLLFVQFPIVFDFLLCAFNFFAPIFHHRSFFRAFDDFPFEFLRALIFHHLLNMVIQFFLGIYFIRRFYDHISLDIELGKVKFEVVLVSNHTLAQIFFQLILKISGDGMLKKLAPIDPLCWINHQHSFYYIFDHFWNFVRKYHWLFSDLLQQINDV